MSGDVQPRKRKDKKKKKDDLGVEEPRGTAAALGEGDVFMHSHSEHSTGGHWCAKVIFFSLLTVLITLIGLIILENRGLTELEANSVESRYSGVLEGWIEDTTDDDHHDEHTLELKHHDEDEADHGSELEHDDDDDDENDEHEDDDENDEHDDEDENDEHDDENEDDDSENDDVGTDQDADDSQEADDDEDEGQESEEQNLFTSKDEDDIEEPSYRKYYKINENVNEDDDEDDDNDDLQKGENDDQLDNTKDDQEDDNHDVNLPEDDDDNDDDEKQSNESEEDKTIENNNDDDNDSNESDDYLQNDATREDEEEHEEEEEEPANIEIETIEKEASDDDNVSTEEPAAEDEEQSLDVSEELSPNEDDSSLEDDDVEFLEPDDLDELPIVEPSTAPAGKPLAEVGESPSTEKPQDTLADEEEYERKQEELRKEREQASQSMWLKLTIGGALLVATHAVLRRATASRDTEEEEPDFREETPLSDRRMTLITDPVPPPTVAPNIPEVSQPIEREVKREPIVNVQSSMPANEEIEVEDEEIVIFKPVIPVQTPKGTIDKEFYSDEEEIEEELEDEEEEIIEPIKAISQQAVPQTPQTIPDVTKEVTPEPDEDDDVEIIDDEQLEEELEEEEISDVDDAELLSRLEEKYGRLPEPDRRTQKDGGNSIEEEWPGEPADAFWNEHLEQAQRELRQGDWTAAFEKASSPGLQASARARYIAAQALDAAAEDKKDNQLLNKAIAAYLELLKMSERLSDKKLLEVATRTLDRIRFRGTYLSAEPVYKLLIRRFPDDPAYRNNLTISLLMANRADLAENVLIETLKLWPNDRVALAHHGFILKTLHNRHAEAVEAFTKALEGDEGAANEPRFYYHLGDALLLLGRFKEAHEVHKRGAELGHFLSPSQRSLYNVDRLKSQPWWNIDQTPYSKIVRALEKSWKDILKEGEAAKALYEKEKEGLKERGEWSQLDLFARGREVPNRCARAPVTCGIVKSEGAASGCRRGQIKFSMMEAGTHVRPHVGPTNCRLRMHLGLSNTKDTFIRVDHETRQWQTGQVLIFDDSFEHEVWHNGTGTRLVLIVDVWHPDLTPAERRQLPAI